MIDENQNPLDIDLSTADISRPLLAGPQNMDLKVEKAQMEDGKSNPNARMLSLELSTVNPQQSVNGDTLGAGIRVFHRSNVRVTGKLKPSQIAEELASIVQAAGGISGAKASNVEDWHKQLEGKILSTRVVIEPETTKNGRTYPAKNAVGRFLPAKR